jgi:phenylpyruvate tautomerase PptA (4-oxalocrotonate tautomerase family)
MPVSDEQFAALVARVTRLEVLVRQLQSQLPPLTAVASQEVPRGS